jgi:hypothetical protein
MAANYGKRTRSNTPVGRWLGNGLVLEIGSYESIATTTVGSGGSATVSFSSIPATYKHLQLRCLARTDRAATEDQLRITLNSDTGSTYSDHTLSGDGASATSGATANNTYMFLGRSAAASATASMFGVTVIDILDYADTNKYKTARSLSGVDLNGSGKATLLSGSWRSTSAVTSIQVTFIGSNMAQYSHFALYGIKG